MNPNPGTADTPSRVPLGEQAKQVQVCTFKLGHQLYGVHAEAVQEVVRSLPITPVPLSPAFIKGLINLRGQIAAAIDLRCVFKLPAVEIEAPMNMVCAVDGLLFSLLADDIGDVVEVQPELREPVPETVPASVRRFISDVYRLPDCLLCVIELETLILEMNRVPEGESP